MLQDNPRPRLEALLKSQPAGYRNDVRNYSQFYVIAVTEGTLHFSDESGAAEVSRGRMAVLRPGSSFVLHTAKTGYSGVAVEVADARSEAYGGRSLVTDPTSRIAAIAEWLEAELSVPGERSDRIVTHLCALVVETALRETRDHPPAEPQLARSAYWARRATEAIENSIYAVQGVREALSGFPVSYRQLSRFLAAETGMTPKRIQMQARLREARRLLRETDWSVITIALELGFSSAQHFAGAFSKVTGLPPARWRSATRETGGSLP